ncbi:hemicentin-2 [Sphaeramia orbicularis]|uniref:Hemicentin-2-like n=1 Tax=Sphaeramia orbicularis TaxID=375764 RepID=A0A673A119_9TELE|nr:hemicentin-2-like [Sphaeramia orbicularis]
MWEYSILMVMTFLSTGVQCERTEVFVQAGAQAILPCKCSSVSSSSPTIIWSNNKTGTVWRKDKSGLQYRGHSWTKDGPVRIHCPHTLFERGDCSLHINHVREEDAGIYSCSVQHEKKHVETEVMLRVIKVSVVPSSPLMGRSVSISCGVTPWPYSATLRWTLNDSPYDLQTTNINTLRTVETKASENLVGKWTCVVGYKSKTGQASAHLSVKGIRQPAKDNAKVYAAVGSATTLPCVFSPGLIPTDLSWDKLKVGYLFKPAIDHLPPSFSPPSPSINVTWDKSANLREVGFEDAGTYRCSGTVEGQKMTRNMQLVVAKVDTTVSSKKNIPMTLTCQLTDTSDVTEYVWVHVTYDVNGSQSIGSIHKGKTLALSQVSEDNRGEWACRFYGKEGFLGNVTYNIQLMSHQSGEKPASLSQNTAAVVGLSILLLVLLLVLVQMYKNHQRRKKIFQCHAMETIIHTIANEREERERNQMEK